MQRGNEYRTVWLSDVHLGSRACRAGLLLDFLERTTCETLYLVGDIVDLERLRRSFYWPQAHTEVLRAILAKSQQGARVVYIPGNHDDEFRVLAGQMLGPIEVRRRDVHTMRDGKRLLVLHGDEFDRCLGSRSLARLAGQLGYCALLRLNRIVHGWRAWRGQPYWSLAQHVKTRLPKAIGYVENFQRACIEAAKEEGMDGVVCGHIHQAALIEDRDFVYCNDGDWVESCTAIVENAHGQLALLSHDALAPQLNALAIPIQRAA